MHKTLLQSRWQFDASDLKSISTAIAIVLIAGCATNTTVTGQNDQTHSITQQSSNSVFIKQGRMSIKVDSETPQSLSGAFEIKGSAVQGDLSLFSPIGSTVAQVSWSPTQAILIANNETKRFDHIDALMQELTGTVLPLNALYDWLMAVPTPAEGWQVDLSQMLQAERPRLFAKRSSPLPVAELRVVLEP